MLYVDKPFLFKLVSKYNFGRLFLATFWFVLVVFSIEICNFA